MPHPFSHGGGKRPATGNIILGMMLTLSGIGALIVAFIPMALRTAVAMYPADAVQAAGNVDPRAWYAIGGVLLVGLGAGSALRPRGYRALVRHPLKSRTVVYFDFENQSVSAPFVEKFMQYIDKNLPADAHPDLFFFVDVASTGQSVLREVYAALRAHGFTLIDVPHRQRDDGRRPPKNIKNLVDMTLAIKALERALIAEEPQHFVIIAEDLIYLPLIHRLRTLGHSVSLWSRDIHEIYQRFALNAGVDVLAFGNQFSRASRPIMLDDRTEDNG